MKKIPPSLFNISTIKRDPFQGALLVAEPLLKESYFNHSVISLIDYGRHEGAMGVVMNNITGHHLAQLLDGVSTDVRVPVFCGGPISLDRLFFIHTLGQEIIPDAKEYTYGLYVGGSFKAAIDYVNTGYPTEGNIRFFVGYSGWDSGQLDQELNDDVWAVADNPGDLSLLLKGHGNAYWHRTVKDLGEPYRTWRLHPRDARSN